MKMQIAIISLLTISSTVFAKGLTETEKQEAMEASNYGLCHELKLRPAKGDEVLVQVNCANIIKGYELKIEKKSLLSRIKSIDAELKVIESSDAEAP